jgi:hypothetical protein
MSQQATVLTMREISLRLALIATILLSSLLQPFSLRADDDQHEAFYFHSPVPLGIDAVRILPSRRIVYLLASAENQSLDGIKVDRTPHIGRVARSDGSEVKSYPGALDFRVTATALPNDFRGIDEFDIKSEQPINQFLLGLKFKLKIYRGLHLRTVAPTNVNLIGVPSDQPFDERVYRVSFDTPNLPVDARLVLEVYDANGTRLTRFHLEML